MKSDVRGLISTAVKPSSVPCRVTAASLSAPERPQPLAMALMKRLSADRVTPM